MELRDLRYFEGLSAELSFTRAAATLHITQPALSLAILRLEKQVGCPLVQRGTNGVSLTQAGSVLLAETQGLLHAVDRACDLAKRAGAGAGGTLAVGFLDAAAFDILPRVLEEYRAAYPDVETSLRQLTSSALVRGVQSGALDVAFARPDLRCHGVQTTLLRRDRMYVAVSRDNPLGRSARLRMSDLAGQSFVFPERGVAPGMYARWIEHCAAALFEPRIVAHVSSTQTIVELVAHDVGVAFVTRSWVRDDERVVLLELSDREMFLDMCLAYRPDSMSPACSNFVASALRTLLFDSPGDAGELLTIDPLDTAASCRAG